MYRDMLDPFIILYAVHEFNLHAIGACYKLYTCKTVSCIVS